MEAFARDVLPKTQVLNFHVPDSGENLVEFRLVYGGHLPPEKWSYQQDYAKATDKHRIRKEFHLQLRELWATHPDLSRLANSYFIKRSNGEYSRAVQQEPGAKTWINHIADENVRCMGNRFVPFIREANGLTCSLDILFLRRDYPGVGLITWGGDIDSRIKVLLDGLKMPRDVKDLGDYKEIASDENPFFCLLEDDKLVTSISVTTDRLIVLPKPNEPLHDVLLIVHVTAVDPSALFAGDVLI